MPGLLRIGLFLLLWRELTRCFDLGEDLSLLLAVGLFYGGAIVKAFDFEIEGLTRDDSATLVAWGILWIVLFVWLAPEFLKRQAISVIACEAVGLVLLGRWLHIAVIQQPARFAPERLQPYSEAVVGVMLAALGTCVIAERHWGSLLPLAGYAALVVLPLAFGWKLIVVLDEAFDAEFGKREDFGKSGLNEDR